jgi:hypothetical protein
MRITTEGMGRSEAILYFWRMLYCCEEKIPGCQAVRGNRKCDTCAMGRKRNVSVGTEITYTTMKA